MKGMFCAACRENLRGRKAVLFDGKPVCLAPCGSLAKVRKTFHYGVLEVTGPELLRLFVLEASSWTGPELLRLFVLEASSWSLP